MPAIYWIVALPVVLVHLWAGGGKLLRPEPVLITHGGGRGRPLDVTAVRSIGTLEIIAALGVVIPVATGVAPVLSPMAAIGLAIFNIGAGEVRAHRGEREKIPAHGILGALGLAILALLPLKMFRWVFFVAGAGMLCLSLFFWIAGGRWILT